MKKLIQRLLVFFIGVPLVIVIVVGLPQKNHLAVNIITILLSALGALEFSVMLKRKSFRLHPAKAVILGALGPLAMTLIVSFGITGELVPAAFILGAIWCLLSGIFVSREGLAEVIGHVTAGFSVMIYPGLFMIWIVRMTRLPYADKVILLFLLTVFANDSAAWAAGMLLGRGNRGIIPASPNKSAAGFVGGLAASILAGLAAVFLFRRAFIPRLLPFPAAGIILGLLSGIAASFGDLAESAMKRSSDIKDSGTIIPGRGGVLDTIDSIALTAPVYYGLYWVLFKI
jgi:phosphatidate cytidylyltransferase